MQFAKKQPASKKVVWKFGYDHDRDYDWGGNDLLVVCRNGEQVLEAGFYEMEQCCGINQFTGWNINCTPAILKKLFQLSEFHAYLKSESGKIDIILATVPSVDKKNRALIAAMRAGGWSCVAQPKSKHGRYRIHLMMYTVNKRATDALLSV